MATHIIIDEAGKATEPELVLALTNRCSEDSQIILAVDLYQLGPLVTSVEANHSTTNKLLSFASLPNKEFPMIIHYIKGSDSTCETTSIANDEEAELIQDYAKQLLEHGLPADQIGIISPYARQVR